jgi:hypothetical protein
MTAKKKDLPWPETYERPEIVSVHTAFQQAMGITYCASGTTAGGGSGSCGMGSNATGTPGEPGACKPGASAKIGPGGGNSPCSPGQSACAQG